MTIMRLRREDVIMRLRREDVEARAFERGYALDFIQPCFIRKLDDGLWEVDVESPHYPKARDTVDAIAVAAPPAHGPGTELKKLLQWIGITSSPTCSCNARARQMDEWGPDECEKRLPEIVGWLEEQAKARKLPFVRFGAEQAVKLAIRRARKAARS